ncbi:MAG TPA: TolC family protein [Flavobacteriaceae bacterium]|nr:TolC family protein [Flavobacteriaceae bacterium]
MVLQLSKNTIENQNLNNHPKLQSLNFKLKQQEVDTQLKRNKLLPTLNLEYNFLTQNPDLSNTFNTVNYKSGLYFTMPLFLRKERGELKLAKVKLDYTKFEISNTQVTLLNTLKALQTELESFEKQNTYLQKIVTDYQLLVTAEERKLEMGDSSIFLINTRENALIDAKLKAVELQYHFLVVKAKLFNNLAVNPNS